MPKARSRLARVVIGTLAYLVGAIAVVLSIAAFSNARLPYNEQGRYFDGVAVHHVDAVVVYGLLALLFWALTGLLVWRLSRGLSESGRGQLPPGQRESQVFHRFGLIPFASRFPSETEKQVLRFRGAVRAEQEIEEPLKGLPRVCEQADFHCVTTWSATGLSWQGVRFRDFYHQVIVPRVGPLPGATLVAMKAQDGARTGMLLDDLLDPSVLLADHLNGEPLSVVHGAPLRLVAPKHYGYKWAKYLREMEFRRPGQGYRVSGFRFMDHPRARVAHEERGRYLPGRLLRFLYRPLIRPTASRFAKAFREYQKEPNPRRERH